MAKQTSPSIYPECPIRNILARVSDKWSLLILHALDRKSPLRFSELRHDIADVTPKMLSSSLKTLEEDGIIYRKAYPEVPPRVEYGLTERGNSMLASMQPLTDWAVANMEAILTDRARHNNSAPSPHTETPCRQ